MLILLLGVQQGHTIAKSNSTSKEEKRLKRIIAYAKNIVQTVSMGLH